jgi:hypothetical protein
MARSACVASFAFLSILGFATLGSADTLRCQSVNGNVNCAGSNGVACQTVNGKKTCVSGHGDVVQSFGEGTSSSTSGQDSDAAAMADDEGMDDTSTSRGTHKHQGKHGGTGGIQ